MSSEEKRYLWWQKGIIYQIYPRSFMDSNGDGIGDLPGITSKLGYLEWLGVDAIWISPIYPSPMADFGYDVADYTDIHPIFGTLDDFDRLVEEAHSKGLKVILDWVPNHTSDEHPWFIESRSSRDNPKRDWYIWRDPAPDGGPPNNWQSVFGGSAWEYDERTGQYYYHAFLAKQPDLNWRNPEVQEAMLNTLRFWFDRGVDGFRVDVMWHLIKDDQFRDNPINPDYKPGAYLKNLPEGVQLPQEIIEMAEAQMKYLPVYNTDRPEVHDIVRKIRQVADEYPERVIIGEIYLPVERLVKYYGEHGDGAHMPFNFQLILLPWNADEISHAIDAYEKALPENAWPNWVLGNHDNHRIASRVGRDQARVAAMLLLTLRGTPTMYYGDEIGMKDVPIPPDMVQDPPAKRFPGLGLGRDPERTPMQWDSGPNAGFTTGTPWLPIADDYKEYNVEVERNDPKSFLSLYRALIGLRRSEPALHVGSYKSLPRNGDLIAYERAYGQQRFIVLLNLGNLPQKYAELGDIPCQVVLSTHMDRHGEKVSREVNLRANEGVILQVEQ